MAKKQLVSARQLMARWPLSSPIEKAIRASRAEEMGGLPTITVKTFLYALATSGGPYTAGEVVQRIFEKAMRSQLYDRLVAKAAPHTEPFVSPAIYDAFAEAVALRERTGGQDRFIGMRHVLFTIFSNPAPTIAAERNTLLNALGIKKDAAVQELAEYCVRYAEPREDLKVWRDVFASLGIAVAISRFGEGAIPDLPQAKRRKQRARPATSTPDEPGSTPDDGSVPRSVPRDPEVALLDSDDPWGASVQDHAGALREAEAFAAMISARQFSPPLSVGVFGDWGSGKSFFMRLLHESIQRRVEAADEPGSAEGVTFFRHIVQIRFNAWHYAESNLWASLVDHIFTCLDRWAEQRSPSSADRLFDRLTTARRLTVESAKELIGRRRDLQIAGAKLGQAQARLAEERDRLESAASTYVAAAWDALVGPADEQKDLRQAATRLGLGDVTSSAEGFVAAAGALDTELSRYALLRSGALRFLAGPLVIAAVVAGTLLVPIALAWISARIDAAVTPFAAAVAGAFAPVTVALGIAARHANAAIEKVRSFRTRLEAEVVRQTRAAAQNEREQVEKLAEVQTAVAEAEERMRLATERVAEAARDYNFESGRGRVLRFVRERVTKGEYAKHLTFVATVRKDFEELSRLMTSPGPAAGEDDSRRLHRDHVRMLIEQAGDLLDEAEREKLQATSQQEPEASEPSFDRIILYIDDLDRCPPKQVIEVLQAIHLLLTFPLFVVFVAVDVRWLRHALALQYAGQIKEDEASAASASDYLEKIFQVPYWVRPMAAESTRAILRDRMGPASTGLAETPQPDRPTTPTDSQASDESGAQEARADASVPASPGPAASRTVSLRLTGPERALIEQVAGILDGSPRRTLRFINLYRIIKASLTPVELDHLEQKGHVALIVLLALNVAADDVFPSLIRVLELKDGEVLKNVETARWGDFLGKDRDVLERIDTALALFRSAEGNPADLVRYVKLVARFSFNPDVRLVGAAPDEREQAPNPPSETPLPA